MSSSSSACTRRSSCTRPTRTPCAAAVERYEVEHPVLDDPELVTWQAYTARAWPTLVLVDPEGYVVAQYAGEGHAHAIDALVAELREEHRGQGHAAARRLALRRAAGRRPATCGSRPRRSPCPAGASWSPTRGTTAWSSSRRTPRPSYAGSGRASAGSSTAAPSRRFNEPNGLCLLPDDVAAEVGYDVVVADTVNHALRGVHLADRDASARWPAPGSQLDAGRRHAGALSSPWDVAWWQDRVWVAMAGVHQLWTFDPRTGAAEVAAGTANEGLLDGPLAEAWFAQTSGLAAAGDRLWIADSETSSLRYVEAARCTPPSAPACSTSASRTATRAQALLQHPLGVTVLPDGSVAVCDTYNGAVRRCPRRSRSPRSPPGWPSRAAPSSTATTSSSSSRPRTG